MLKLIIDGPGWTDATIFYKLVEDGKESLLGVDQTYYEPIKFNKQSFEEALAELLNCGESWNEDDGIHIYVEEGDTPELTPEDEFYQELKEKQTVEFDTVKDYLESVGFVE